MDDNIRAAIELLDPANDDHWTSSGLPKVGVVAELAECKVTREDIERLAPGLVRGEHVAESVASGGTVTVASGEKVEETAGPEIELPPELRERAAEHAKANARRAELADELAEVDTQIAALNAKREAILDETRKVDAQAYATRDTFAISQARAKATAQMDAQRRAAKQRAYEAATAAIPGHRINPIDAHFKAKGKRRGPDPMLPR